MSDYVPPKKTFSLKNRRRNALSNIDQEKLQTYEKVIKYFNREPMRKNTFFTEELKANRIKLKGWSELPSKEENMGQETISGEKEIVMTGGDNLKQKHIDTRT